ncbi:MAG: formate dehydrogenase accessory sulfurtransferase FdhD [Caulobacteraceae bacterium]
MDATSKVSVAKYGGGIVSSVEDIIAREYALTIILDGDELITLLCTPQNLEYLAVGFLVSESIIADRKDVKNIRVFEDKGIVELETTKSSTLAKKLYGKRTMTTGCGKGATFYNAVDSLSCKIVDSDMKVYAQDILELMRKFNKCSDLFTNTGGVHSACLCTDKEFLLFHEDIGRHNALDKIIGEAVTKGIELTDKLILTTGRISSEILIKAAKRGIPVIVSRSAPTDLAVELANELGVTVIGFARGARMNIYSKKERIVY